MTAIYQWLLIGVSAMASEGGEHAAHHAIEIPTKTVMYQTINLVVLFGFIIYKVGPTMKSFFAERKLNYEKAARESAAALELAQKELSEISQKIKKIEDSAQSDIQTAEAQAKQIELSLLAEAEALKLRIKKEAHDSVENESARAVRGLAQKLLTESMTMAQVALKKDVGQADQVKLQKDFVNKIEGRSV